MIRRLRKLFRTREAYQHEIAQLRRELVLVRTKDALLEELFVQKQQKINRLVGTIDALGMAAALRAGLITPVDLRPEKEITSLEQAMRDLSRDFDERQRQYEQTGQYDRQERVLTGDPPAADDISDNGQSTNPPE